MPKFKCSLIGGEIPIDEPIIIIIEAANVGYALPLAIVGYDGAYVKEVELITE